MCHTAKTLNGQKQSSWPTSSTTAVEIDDDAHEVHILGQSYWKQRIKCLQVQCSNISMRSVCMSTSDGEAKSVAFLPNLFSCRLLGWRCLQTALLTGQLS